jgi:CRISPR-associated endonuclease/helicase Cas3
VEQTADVFRAALGAEAVLEHHSAFDPGRLRLDPQEEERPSGEERHRQAAENWDAPVVVTTAVQLFESLFAARPARCRKLHNLARTVIVLDEAQTLPLPLLNPCVAALDELALNYGASIVLMTATQPALKDPDLKDGLRDVRELAPPDLGREPAFRRVTVQHHAEPLDDTALAARLRTERQALCIVNSRRHARELYEAIRDDDDAFHLSTLMCAAHRREVLAGLRQRLKAGAPVRLVSTSLIEAGVDISFPLVLRAEAGLDQVAQAAGRCNREGELPDLGRVEVFASTLHKPMPEIEQRAAAGRSGLRRHPDEPLGEAAIARFFREMHLLKGEAALDAKQILEKFAERASSLDFPFATVAEQFAMIEDRMVPIIIRYDEKARAFIAELEHAPFIGRAARRLQPYTAQVPRSARGLLLSAGAARSVREADYPGQFVVLENRDLYRPDLGLTWDDPTLWEAEKLVW